MRKRPIFFLRRLTPVLATAGLAVAVLVAGCGGKKTTTSQPANEATATLPAAEETAPGLSGQPEFLAPGSATQTPAVPATPSGTAGIVLQAIQAAQQALLNAEAFQCQTTIRDLNTGQVISSTLEYQAPDRIRLQSRDLDTLVISSTTYVNDHQAGWQISSTDLEGVTELLKGPEILQTQSAELLQEKNLGSDTIEGTPVQGYEYNTTREGVTSTVKLWISPSDHLPRKIEIESEAATVRTAAEIIYTYQKIEIQQPTVQK